MFLLYFAAVHQAYIGRGDSDMLAPSKFDCCACWFCSNGRGALACSGTAARSRAYGVVALRQSQSRWRRGVLNPTEGTGKQTQRREPSLRQPKADGRISVREAHRVGTPHACAHPDLLLVRCSAGPARRRPLLERAADAGGGQLLAVQLRGAACPDALPLQPRLASPHGGRRPTPRSARPSPGTATSAATARRCRAAPPAPRRAPTRSTWRSTRAATTATAKPRPTAWCTPGELALSSG